MTGDRPGPLIFSQTYRRHFILLFYFWISHLHFAQENNKNNNNYYYSFKVKEIEEIKIQSNLQSLVSLSLSLSTCHLGKEINSVATLLVRTAGAADSPTAGAANHSCRELTVPLHPHQKVASLLPPRAARSTRFPTTYCVPTPLPRCFGQH